MSNTSWIRDDGHVRYLSELGTYEIIDRPLWYHLRGLQQTASGYGRKLTSSCCVKLASGKIYRVYITQYSNAGTAWVTVGGVRYVVTE